MKKIIAFTLVLIAILMGGYYITGGLIESNLKKNISNLDNTNKIKVSISGYKKGFIKSEAQLNWELIIPAKVIMQDGKRIFKPSKTYYAYMPLTVYHGPIIFHANKIQFGLGLATSHIMLPGKYIEQFNEKYTSDSTKPELDLDIFVNYFNNTSIKLRAPQFHLIANNDNSDFAWSGMTTEIDLSSNMQEVNGKVIIAGVTWLQDKTLSVLKNVESYYQLHKSDFGLYLGDSRLHIPEGKVTQNDSQLIEVKELDFKANSFIENKLFNSSLKINLDKFYIYNEIYKNCSVDFYLRNLDAQVLLTINNILKSAQNRSERERKQAILSILPELPKLVNKGAEIEVSDFNIAMHDGVIRGNMLISMPKDNNINPFYLVQRTRGIGHISISKKLLKTILTHLYEKSNNTVTSSNTDSDLMQKNVSGAALQNKSNNSSDDSVSLLEEDLHQKAAKLANNKLEDMIKLGVLIPAGEEYVTDIKILQGRIIVNDKPFNPDMLRFKI